MQFKQTVLLLCLLLPFLTFSQTTYLQQDSRDALFLDRTEILLRTDSVFNFSKTKPLSRRMMITHLMQQGDNLHTDKVQAYNLRRTWLSNIEWVDSTGQGFASRKPIWKHFYKTPANLYEVRTNNFDLIVNPVIQYVVTKESNNDQHLFLNTRGLTLRGRIANKVGFAAYITDNQERPPLYVQDFVRERKAVPGAGFYKDFKAAGGLDYFDARGYITANVARVIDIAFGYDKNFIGSGFRSLYLSDFAAPALFLKTNTRVWKLNYQTLFMELTSANRLGADNLFPKKYAAMHHLDIGVTRWLNVGLFEGIVFGRKDRFEFGYLNPIIFYRSVEQQLGSFDNAVAGLDVKANVGGKAQFYGQFLLDEFSLQQVRKNNGWWANKFGIQAGAKYINALGIKNLDLQVEYNRVRPFTYSHRDSIANYTHYNQPLAHPLGANFTEVLGLATYQPLPRLLLQAKAMYMQQGRDSGAVSFGGNIFLPNVAPFRTKDEGYTQNNGVLTKIALASLLISYEVRPNLFAEINAQYRRQRADVSTLSRPNSTIIAAGIRWNMHRRVFDF